MSNDLETLIAEGADPKELLTTRLKVFRDAMEFSSCDEEMKTHANFCFVKFLWTNEALIQTHLPKSVKGIIAELKNILKTVFDGSEAAIRVGYLCRSVLELFGVDEDDDESESESDSE